MGETNKTSSAQ